MKKKKVIIKIASALQKIFPDQKKIVEQSSFSIFQNESFSFQVCLKPNEFVMDLSISVASELSEFITVRRVDCVPSRFAQFETRCDDYYIFKRGRNRLYPDVLRPICENEVLRPFDWTCFYVTVSGALPVGDFDLQITAKGKTYVQFEKTAQYRLRVLEGELPKHDLTCTQWVHYDCICDKHRVQPFTDEFYAVTNEYLKSAVKHGQNMLLTPLFTPPLDTAVGKHRKTVQLVEVEEKNGEYFFSFENVKRFFDNALSLGFEYFEIAHFASQWGADKALRIQIRKDGRDENAFGWATDSSNPAYLHFLEEFLSAFRVFVEKNGYMERLYFHVSDEPPSNAMEKVVALQSLIKKHFPNNKIMDAVASKDYFNSIDMPFIPLNEYEDVPSPYVYYCNMTRKGYVSNRFLSMPSQRTRILGMQLYRNRAKGFLHWALNFYNASASRYPIDPYAVTDGDGTYDGGDPFVVYPAEEGVLESIRHELFLDAWQDLRALVWLEALRGRAFVEELLARYKIKEGYTIYLRKAEKLLELRLKINEEIERAKRELR